MKTIQAHAERQQGQSVFENHGRGPMDVPCVKRSQKQATGEDRDHIAAQDFFGEARVALLSHTRLLSHA